MKQTVKSKLRRRKRQPQKQNNLTREDVALLAEERGLSEPVIETLLGLVAWNEARGSQAPEADEPEAKPDPADEGADAGEPEGQQSAAAPDDPPDPPGSSDPPSPPEQPSAPSAPEPPEAPKPKATKAAEELAAEEEIDLTQVKGSGIEYGEGKQKILIGDVKKATAKKRAAAKQDDQGDQG